MATSKFTDLALLWPFANELDQTLFVYNFSRTRDYVDLGLPLHDSMAMFTLSTALGHILMDDSMPQFYLVAPENSGDACKDKNRHLIYIGGGIHNQAVRNGRVQVHPCHIAPKGFPQIPPFQETPHRTPRWKSDGLIFRAKSSFPV